MLAHKEPESHIKVSWGQAQQTYPVSARLMTATG
jgi:hypothetical protein